MAEKKKQRGLKEALEQTRMINSPLFHSSLHTKNNSRTKGSSENLIQASRSTTEWTNILVKEDKLQKLSDLVKFLGITDNDKIQQLKRYIAFKEANSYFYGVRDGENSVKQEFRDLLHVSGKDDEDDNIDWL